LLNPVMDAREIEVTGPNEGRVALAGEPVHLAYRVLGSRRPLRSRGRGREGSAGPLRPTG
jgi:hypothetical protein